MINQITSTALKQDSSATPSTGSSVNQSDVINTPTPKSQSQQNTSFSPESGLRIVNDKVVESIDKELAKTNAKPIRDLDTKNFTPEAVATGILKFVQGAISRAKTRGQPPEALLEQAKIGIENGFEQAKNILVGLNALSGKIAEGVQQTYNLIQNGLGRLDSALRDGTTVNFDAEIPTMNQAVQTQSQSSRISQTFELNIKTNDGDNVQLSISRNQSDQSYNASLVQGGQSTAISQVKSNTDNKIQLSITGNLDKAEVKAIQDLLAEVKAVSESFFEGDVNAAFEAGLSLGFNTQEIASFALDINQNYTQTASRAYREINSFGSEGSRPSPAQLENLLKPAHEFVNALQNDIEKINNSDLFKNSNSNPAEGLFNYFSRTNPNNANQIQKLESLAGQPFENITQQLISSIG